MYIYNKKKSIKIVVDELPNYANKEFYIYQFTPEGCVIKTAILNSTLDEKGTAEITLKDGRYIFCMDYIIPDELPNDDSLEQDNGKPDLPTTPPEYDPNRDYLSQEFIVFYNFLPELITTIKDSFCKDNCVDCITEDKEENILKSYYRISLYLNCTGLFNELLLLKRSMCEQNKILDYRCEYSKSYGTFKFNYIDSIKKVLSYLYANLYRLTILNIKDDETDLKDFNSLFEVELIKKCLYLSGVDLERVFCEIETLKCDCNG